MPEEKECVRRQKDGSLRARGRMSDGLAEGYREWFRKDIRPEWGVCKVTIVEPWEEGATTPLTGV